MAHGLVLIPGSIYQWKSSQSSRDPGPAANRRDWLDTDFTAAVLGMFHGGRACLRVLLCTRTCIFIEF